MPAMTKTVAIGVIAHEAGIPAGVTRPNVADERAAVATHAPTPAHSGALIQIGAWGEASSERLEPVIAIPMSAP